MLTRGRVEQGTPVPVSQETFPKARGRGGKRQTFLIVGAMEFQEKQGCSAELNGLDSQQGHLPDLTDEGNGGAVF